jgi:hypothetical protein
MTYGRVHLRSREFGVDGAAVSHSAELVRGEFFTDKGRPPHPPFGHLLPKGRRDFAAFTGDSPRGRR